MGFICTTIADLLFNGIQKKWSYCQQGSEDWCYAAEIAKIWINKHCPLKKVAYT